MAAATLTLALDQLTKLWAVAALESGPVHVVGPLRLALVYNKAGAFGLGGAFVPFLAVAALAVVLVMATSGSATTRPLVAVSLGLLLGGAIGNVADRLVRGSGGFLQGGVVDFVDVGFWPVFNLADSAITCGCFLLLWANRGPERPPERGTRPERPPERGTRPERPPERGTRPPKEAG